jgi:hypothetical protein
MYVSCEESVGVGELKKAAMAKPYQPEIVERCTLNGVIIPPISW